MPANRQISGESIVEHIKLSIATLAVAIFCFYIPGGRNIYLGTFHLHILKLLFTGHFTEIKEDRYMALHVVVSIVSVAAELGLLLSLFLKTSLGKFQLLYGCLLMLWIVNGIFFMSDWMIVEKLVGSTFAIVATFLLLLFIRSSARSVER